MKAPVQMITSLFATSLVTGLCIAAMAPTQETEKYTQDGAMRKGSPKTAAFDKTQDPIEMAVKESEMEAAFQQRQKLLEEAVVALNETHKALRALDAKDTKSAVASLNLAVGKLEQVTARNPNLKLAPVDFRLMRYDFYSSVDDVERVRERAAKHLKDGRLQDARALIEELRSDCVVEVYNLPLATFPSTIKSITPMINQGKIDLAKKDLQNALNTVVVTKQVHPLPIMRAEQMLTRAEALAEMANRHGEQNAELKRLLDGTRSQLEFAQSLGYGHKSDFNGFYEQLQNIAKKTEGGRSGTGFFDSIQKALRSFGESTPGSY